MFVITAVGDISFEGPRKDNPSLDIFSRVVSRLKAGDICVANLESPLTLQTNGTPGKCNLRGHPDWAQILRQAGIGLVSLANNHMMDYGVTGLQDTVHALDANGIAHVGAGCDLAAACAPVFKTVNGHTVAFLARSAVQVSSPSYAKADTPGVAFFDELETAGMLQTCRQDAEFTILLIHWGLEHYKYPTPDQRRTARNLIKAGADLILGHHPHVQQGLEYLSGKPVVYSLGNFAFEEIDWSIKRPDGSVQPMRITLPENNRRAGIITMRVENTAVKGSVFQPTRINTSGRISEMLEPFWLNRLSAWFNRPFYDQFWRLYSFVKEFELRLLPHFRGKIKLSNITKVRPRHFFELIKTIVRSKRIISGKSTNPYE